MKVINYLLGYKNLKIVQDNEKDFYIQVALKKSLNLTTYINTLFPIFTDVHILMLVYYAKNTTKKVVQDAQKAQESHKKEGED